MPLCVYYVGTLLLHTKSDYVGTFIMVGFLFLYSKEGKFRLSSLISCLSSPCKVHATVMHIRIFRYQGQAKTYASTDFNSDMTFLFLCSAGGKIQYQGLRNIVSNFSIMTGFIVIRYAACYYCKDRYSSWVP